MKRILPWLVVASTLLASGSAWSRPFRVNQVPNGSVQGCQTCHSANFPELNPFGQTIKMNFLSAPGALGNVLWSPKLASLDADGDGRSNGAELLDPSGSWSSGSADPGSADDVTAPGVADASSAVAAPALSGALQGALALGLLGLCGVGIGGRGVVRREVVVSS